MNSIELLPQQINSVHFPQEDVLQDQESIKLRKENLEKAMTLGNLYKGKVKIYFKSNVQEVFSIHTTIWSVGEQFVTIKEGKTIPLNAICEVEL